MGDEGNFPTYLFSPAFLFPSTFSFLSLFCAFVWLASRPLSEEKKVEQGIGGNQEGCRVKGGKSSSTQ